MMYAVMCVMHTAMHMVMRVMVTPMVMNTMAGSKTACAPNVMQSLHVPWGVTGCAGMSRHRTGSLHHVARSIFRRRDARHH
jgi:hypothetical protein